MKANQGPLVKYWSRNIQIQSHLDATSRMAATTRRTPNRLRSTMLASCSTKTHWKARLTQKIYCSRRYCRTKRFWWALNRRRSWARWHVLPLSRTLQSTLRQLVPNRMKLKRDRSVAWSSQDLQQWRCQVQIKTSLKRVLLEGRTQRLSQSSKKLQTRGPHSETRMIRKSVPKSLETCWSMKSTS